MTAVEVTVDASVALKWLFASGRAEQDTGPALALLDGVREGLVTLRQPAHFLLEVAAVTARESPATAAQDLLDLLQVQFELVDGPDLLFRALALALEHRQHVFDTLYHAVALERDDAVLVTADERYWRAARGAGRIVRLADFASMH